MKRNGDGGNAADQGALNAFLDHGSTFEGKLTFKGAVRIDGTFKGEIQSDDTLLVGESGRIEGEIEVGEAVVSGRVDGRLKATRRAELSSTAVFTGEIVTAALAVEEGATVDGSIAMQGSKGKAAPSELERAVESTLDRESSATKQ